MPRKKSGKGKGSNKAGNKKPAQEKKEEKKVPASEAVPMEQGDDKKVKKGDAKKSTEVTEVKEEEKEVKIDPKVVTRTEIKAAVLLIHQAVTAKESRLFSRVLRLHTAIRQGQTPAILSQTVEKYCPDGKHYLADFAKAIVTEEAEDLRLADEAAKAKAAEAKAAAAKEQEKKDEAGADEVKKDTKDEEKAKKDEKDKKAKEAEKKEQRAKEEIKKLQEAAQMPEVKAFVHLLVCVYLIDQKKKELAGQCSKALVDYVQSANRRSMDLLSAKAYYFYSLTHETLNQLEAIRSPLLLAHRTACLQHNEPGQAALIVAILRNYLACKLYNQADKFRLNCTFPESRASVSNFYARYLFYIGQINALQLQYSDAYSNLMQAMRKAPQHGALGFRQKVNKLLVIVQLLMGEVPERSVFRGDMKRSLKPYLLLTQAVRVGDLAAFESVVEKKKNIWAADELTSLIVRLRNNVIKTGLRKINMSYSRISLEDVCSKLNLPSVEDAEFIVAKCIHDGVIDAVIDRENRFMFSKENPDRYSSHAPQAVFHKRIMFCMDIHNGAVKALRFPPNAHKKPDPDADLNRDDDVELEADSMEDD